MDVQKAWQYDSKQPQQCLFLITKWWLDLISLKLPLAIKSLIKRSTSNKFHSIWLALLVHRQRESPITQTGRARLVTLIGQLLVLHPWVVWGNPSCPHSLQWKPNGRMAKISVRISKPRLKNTEAFYGSLNDLKTQCTTLVKSSFASFVPCSRLSSIKLYIIRPKARKSHLFNVNLIEMLCRLTL